MDLYATGAGTGSARYTRIRTYNSAVPSYAVSPSSLTSGTTGNTVTLTGTNTAWTTGTTFGATSTGTGAAITAQSVNAGSQVATLTVTAGTAGTLTYSDSADAATAAQPVTLTLVVIAATDSNLFFSPYTWNSGVTVDGGAYLLASLTLTNTGPLLLNLNTSTYSGVSSGARPAVWWSIDGGPRQDAVLTDANMSGSAPAQTLQLASSLSGGAHTLALYYRSYETIADQWTPVERLAVTGLTAPTGATTAAVTTRAKRLLNFGDSITDGDNLLGLATSIGAVPSGDSTLAYGPTVALGLGAEYGQVGFGGLGWAATSVGGVPAFPSSWPYYYSGVSRLTGGLLVPAPDYVLVNMGTNGNTTGTLATSGSTGTARAQMTAMRAAAGSGCKDIYLVPFGQYARSALLNDLSFYGGGTTASNGYTSQTFGTSTVYASISDPSTWVIDLGTAGQSGLIGSASPESFDSVHPNQYGQSRRAALIVAAIKAKEAGTSTGGTKRRLQ